MPSRTSVTRPPHSLTSLSFRRDTADGGRDNPAPADSSDLRKEPVKIELSHDGRFARHAGHGLADKATRLLVMTVLALCACTSDRPLSPSMTGPTHATSVAAVTAMNTVDTLALGVSYVPGSIHPHQVMDVFRTSGISGNLPAVICVHGGSWLSGDRHFGPSTACAEALRRGAVVASIEYRFSTDSVWPAQMHDVFTAVRCIRAAASKLHVDTARLAMIGLSAGAHLTLMAGVASTDSALLGLGLGCANQGSNLKAIVSVSGPTDFLSLLSDNAANGCATDSTDLRSLYRLLGLTSVVSPADTARIVSASPVANVRRAPPMQLWNGDHDCTVAYQQMQRMENAVLAGFPLAVVEQNVVVGSGHNLPGDTSISRRIADFLERYLR
ncbi:MAG: alpha/beta hydrolase [Gemmatimonadaceae bacterium]